MSTYWLGVLTLPALALGGFVIWFVAVVTWQEAFMPPRYTWHCTCGQVFSKQSHRTESGMKRGMKRHSKTCAKADYYEMEGKP